MAVKGVPKGVEAVREDYYQITEAILDSFPKYRPPLDLFRFNESLVLLTPYIRKGERLSNEQVEEVHEICREGNLFVSRADRAVYAEHIIKQLSLVLTDEHLTVAEVVDIALRGLTMRVNDFIEQPLRHVFELLYEDCLVVTEYLQQDMHRLKNFMRRLHVGPYSLAAHSVNTMIIGLWLLHNTQGQNPLDRRVLDNAALGLLLHDLGMGKIPSVITAKNGPLKPEEKDKINLHPLVGLKLLAKIEADSPEVKSAVLEHHERFDGSGYPQHFKEASISRVGRICAVADSFSAMLMDRAYAPAKDPLEAARELATDIRHYDKSLSAILLGAYVKKEF